MIHALRMFSVLVTFGDIGLISGRALHQVKNGVYPSRRSRMAKTVTLLQDQNSNKHENKMLQVTSVPGLAQIGLIRGIYGLDIFTWHPLLIVFGTFINHRY